MREILFRGKSVIHGCWEFGDLITSFGKTHIGNTVGNNRDDWCEVYPESVGQFTGLLDKNGKRIFEGDIIVKGFYPYFDNGVKNYVSTVEWIYSSWQEVLHCINPLKNGISDGVNDIIEEDDDDGSTSFEIIGNIHDNQDLLK